MKKTLEMVFRNTENKEVVIYVPSPRDDLTLADVQPVMQDIIAKNIFDTSGGDLLQVVEARVRVIETTALA